MIKWNNIAVFNAPCQLCGGYVSTEAEHIRYRPVPAQPSRGRKRGYREKVCRMKEMKEYIHSKDICTSEELKIKYGSYARRAVEIMRKRGEIISIRRGVYKVMR